MNSIVINHQQIAAAARISEAQVDTVVRLLDAGNTIPFITRYRKDQTGGLDEEQLRHIQELVGKMRLLMDRKQVIRRTIQSQGKLTPELDAEIESALTIKRLEDLYLPFKPKKQTLATAAREHGLLLLSQEILNADPMCANLDARAQDFVNEEKKVPTAADALLGAGHILAELISERADLRGKLRIILEKSGKIICAQGEADQEKSKPYRDYFEYKEDLSKVPPHRVLAINRGERCKALKVRIEADEEAMLKVVDELTVPAEHPHAEFLRGCARDAFQRLVLPSLEREIRRELTEEAETHAVTVFAKNLRNLLLQPPIRDRRLLAIDPGFRSGCKIAVLDEFGNPLDHTIVHLIGKNPEEVRAQAKPKIAEMVARHRINVIVVGNGTACRETEELIGELLASELSGQGIAYVIVNEAGASVYSTSAVGREELPTYDAGLRSAISIGRRLQDPLSELVKIEPDSLGVGLYQHDVKEKHLRESLNTVVESCVNYVGVDLNSASPALLRYVSGLNQLIARRLYDYRTEHGPFKNREQLKEVLGFGEATFVQAAGFLKIAGGDNPLDSTWIHPESYENTRKLLAKLGVSVEDLSQKEKLAEISAKISELDADALATEFQVGLLTLKDLLAQLVRPGRDPRADLPEPIFKQGILKLEDLSPGTELMGTVLNVVDFGAFVDIGLKDSGLVHISQLTRKYVKTPHEVVSVGDIVRVWVMSIDKERRRVSLTMLSPHEEKQRRESGRGRESSAEGEGARERRPRRRGKRPSQAAASGAGANPQGTVPQGAAQQGTAQQGTVQQGDAQQQGRQHAGNQQGGRHHGGRRPPRGDMQHARPAKPKPKPKPLVPLTDAMRKGKEPLRTFGDLKQFIDLKDQPADDQGMS